MTTIKREVMVYIGIRGPGPVCDTKPISLEVPGNKTNDDVREFMRVIFQGLIDDHFQAEQDKYDPHFGDHRKCKCGVKDFAAHTYERHFDTYDNMSPIGCKYCECTRFEEAVLTPPDTNKENKDTDNADQS